MGAVPDADTAADRPDRPDAPERGRDGRVFVVASALFLVLLAAFLLVVSPRLQDGLGLNGPLPFDEPPSTQVVALGTAGAPLEASATWDADGVCAEVVDQTGTAFRTCAVPDPLRPIWAIDAPEEASAPYLLIATPPEVASVEGRLTSGETFAALVEARELPAAWALIPLPEGGVVEDIVALGTNGDDVGGAQCGVEDAPTGGSALLQGGCLVPQED